MEEAKKELDNNNKEKAMEKLQKIARKPHIEDRKSTRLNSSHAQ